MLKDIFEERNLFSLKMKIGKLTEESNIPFFKGLIEKNLFNEDKNLFELNDFDLVQRVRF